MNRDVTLVLILHNRHRNLDRLLDYYKDFSGNIIVADSSALPHKFEQQSESLKYLYTPGISYTRKIELVLKEVATSYVVLCADDDFIIPESILDCVTFLEQNLDYTICQGTCISFSKDSLSKKSIVFAPIYAKDDYSIEADEGLTRLQLMFQKYRSVLYAVHRTDVLRMAFDGAGSAVKNLYLNEYLTAIIPILRGKSKELNLLFQVREYAEGSDDKLTDNLDVVFTNKEYELERRQFLDFLAGKARLLANGNSNDVGGYIFEILDQFSRSDQIGIHDKISAKKKIGLFLGKVPIVGKALIQFNRAIERRSRLQRVLRSEKDRHYLKQIEEVLQKWK